MNPREVPVMLTVGTTTHPLGTVLRDDLAQDVNWTLAAFLHQVADEIEARDERRLDDEGHDEWCSAAEGRPPCNCGGALVRRADCPSVHRGPYGEPYNCTLEVGHQGSHQAEGDSTVLCVWGDS
jgi:hypothetical protein